MVAALHYNEFNNMPKYALKTYKRRSSRRSPLKKFERLTYSAWKRRKNPVKSIQIPRQSRGTVFFPRFNMSPVPRTKYVMLKYCQQISLSGTTGGIVGIEHVFGLNCMYDPDLTGTGHQPMGFDQMMALYTRYRVYKADFKLRPIGTSNAPFLVAMVNNSQTTGTASGIDYPTACERSNCAVKVVGDPNDSVIFGSFKMAEIEGQGIFDDNYTGGVSGNPGNQIRLHLGVGDINGADTCGVNLSVEITFYASLDHRQTLAAS